MKVMKKMGERVISLLLIFSLCITFLSPVYGGTVIAAEVEKETESLILEEINLERADKILLVNSTYQLKPIFVPNEAEAEVVYYSDNSQVAQVNGNGLVTAMQEGTAVISVVAVQDETIRTEIVIEVIDVPEKLELSETEYSMFTGDTFKLTAQIEAVSGVITSNDKIIFESDNPSVAEVNQATGEVKALSEGVANVKASYSFTYKMDGEVVSKTIEAVCKVTVTNVLVSEIYVAKKEITLKIGDIFQLSPVIKPDNATEQGVKYKSGNKKIATVNSNGQIIAKDIGETVITVSSKGNPNVKTEIMVKVYQTVFNVVDFGADGKDTLSDAKVIKKVLEYAKKIDEPITVKIPKGTYYIDSVLTIYSDTNLILDKKAVIKRKKGKSKNAMLRSSINSKLTGYGQCKNVVVSGGVWDGNSDGTEDSDCIYFGHAENITIKNTTVKNTSGAHLIELAGVKNATIDNVKLYGYKKCKKKGYVTNQAVKEAIQLDYCSSITTPAMKPYDNLHCKDITIKNCDIHDYMTGIGSHMIGKKAAENVIIQNNKFSKITDTCIRLLNYKNVTISDNRASGFSTFLYTYQASGLVENNSIKNKSFKKIQTSGLTVQNGITFMGKSNFTVERNTIQNANVNGISVAGKSKAVIKKNTLNSNKMYGIHTSSGTISLSKNTISKNKKGRYNTAKAARIKSSDDIRAYYIPIKKSYKYTGKKLKPKIKIKGLKLNKNYKVTYKNNKKVGKATVIIKGKGKIKGTRKVTFKIVR